MRKANARRLLDYLVRRTIDGEARLLTRASVARACFPGSPDAQLASTEKRRLRAYLQKYYRTEGADSQMNFTLSGTNFEVGSRRVVPGQAASLLPGRGNEMTHLSESFSAVMRGQFKVTLIEGEAGLGKTSLVEAHVRELRQLPLAIQVGFGKTEESAAGLTSYHPLREALADLLRSSRGARREQLLQQLERLAPSWSAYLTEEAGPTRSSGPLSRVQLSRFLAAISAENPLVLILENVHIAEVSALELVTAILEAAPARVQLIITYRASELRGGAAKLPVAAASHGAHVLTLAPLTQSDVIDCVDSRFPNHLFPPELARVIYSSTGGHPLYLKGMLDYLTIDGVVAPDHSRRDSPWCLMQTIDEVARRIPEDVNALTAATLANRAREDQDILLAGALQGDEFESMVISEAISVDPMQTEARLKQIAHESGLIRFVRSEPISIGGASARYRFSHSLYQRSILEQFAQEPTRKIRWSLATAHALVRIYPKDALLSGVIAELLAGGGQHAEALPYYVNQTRALLLSASHQACQEFAQRGLHSLELCAADSNGTLRAELTASLAFSALVSRGYSEGARLRLEDAIRAAEDAQSTGLLPDLLFAAWGMETASGHIESAEQIARRLCQLAESDPLNLGYDLRGHFALGILKLAAGDIPQATSEFDQAALVSPLDKHNIPGAGVNLNVASRCQSARSAWLQGRFAHSRDRILDALAMANRLGDPQTTAYAHVMGASLFALDEDFEQCRLFANRALAGATEYGFIQEQVWATILGCLGTEYLEPSVSNRQRCQHALELYDAFGITLAAAELKAYLANVFLVSHELESGRDAVASGLASADRLPEQYYRAELLRLEGRRLAAEGRSEEAMRFFSQALETAHRQGAYGLVLRTLISLLESEIRRTPEGLAVEESLRDHLETLRGESGPMVLRARRLIADRL